jgi:hypothetical protein
MTGDGMNSAHKKVMSKKAVIFGEIAGHKQVPYLHSGLLHLRHKEYTRNVN